MDFQRSFVVPASREEVNPEQIPAVMPPMSNYDLFDGVLSKSLAMINAAKSRELWLSRRLVPVLSDLQVESAIPKSVLTAEKKLLSQIRNTVEENNKVRAGRRNAGKAPMRRHSAATARRTRAEEEPPARRTRAEEEPAAREPVTSSSSEEEAQSSSVDDSSDVDWQVSSMRQKKKRREEIREEESSSGAGSAEEATPRKRGRPRKHLTSEEDEDEDEKEKPTPSTVRRQRRRQKFMRSLTDIKSKFSIVFFNLFTELILIYSTVIFLGNGKEEAGENSSNSSGKEKSTPAPSRKRKKLRKPLSSEEENQEEDKSSKVNKRKQKLKNMFTSKSILNLYLPTLNFHHIR